MHFAYESWNSYCLAAGTPDRPTTGETAGLESDKLANSSSSRSRPARFAHNAEGKHRPRSRAMRACHSLAIEILRGFDVAASKIAKDT